MSEIEFFLPVLSLVLPLVALFIERLIPAGYFIEELLKAILVYLIPEDSDHKILIGLLVGFLFALTETFIYSTSIFLTGGAKLFATRLLVTALLHTSTTLIMTISRLKTKKFLPLGFLIGVIIHFIYNVSQIPF